MKKFAIILLCLVVLSCARSLQSDSYVASDEAGIVQQGTIVSVRQVNINNADQLDKNGLGIMAGGVAGGVAGSTIGKGNGQALATVGGALAGAALGALAQSELSNQVGYEYIVKVDAGENKKYQDFRQEKEIVETRDSVKDKIKKTVNTPDAETNLISVVQASDVLLQAGQRVYVIHNSDRIRLVAAN